MTDFNNWAGFQFSLSTAEEAEYYFTGEQQKLRIPDFKTLFPSGSYRVVNGQLFRIVEGVPPQFSNASSQVSSD